MDRSQLDAISDTRPILLRHVNGHASVANSPLQVPENLIRLSVGIEDSDDLIRDLAAAMDSDGKNAKPRPNCSGRSIPSSAALALKKLLGKPARRPAPPSSRP